MHTKTAVLGAVLGTVLAFATAAPASAATGTLDIVDNKTNEEFSLTNPRPDCYATQFTVLSTYTIYNNTDSTVTLHYHRNCQAETTFATVPARSVVRDVTSLAVSVKVLS
ncbi:hypothetical protein ACFYOT_35980 [Saccharothrix saharensis]|uniref:hypothetical protein n=1 Tax=Saccharothrix saharensis TaxID=571190 RepID=UPI00367863A1